MDKPLVLLVEDEILVRQFVAEILSEAGFTVLQSGSADEALRVLEAQPDVQLLFTDVELPGSLDGLSLAHLVCRRTPETGILIGSGRVRPGAADLPSGALFLPKPYSLSTLTKVVRTLAGTHRERGLPDAFSAGMNSGTAAAPAHFIPSQG